MTTRRSGSAASAPTWSRSSGSASRCNAGRRCPTGSSPTGEQEYAYEQHDPVQSLAARFGAKEAVMKALGAGLGAFALPRRRGGATTTAARRRSRCTARPLQLADERGVHAWQLSLTHTDATAMAVVLALG